MRTITRLISAYCIALATLFGFAADAVATTPIRILPLGDSLTSGLSNNSVPGAYRNRLHLLLTSAGYQVDFVGTFTDVGNAGLPDVNHQGQGSARIDQIQANLPGWLNAIEDPDVVLLMIGTNDFWQNYQTSTVGTRLSGLIADIAAREPFAKIIVANLPYRSDNIALETQQNLFNATIPGIVAQQVALGRQVSYVDMHSALTPADLTVDGVHPNSIGFGKLADVWFPAIASVISPTGTANPPVIARVGPVTNLNTVPIVFSKPVADSATTLANYTIPGITVNSAVLDAATKRTVTLTTSAQTPGVVYNVSVSGVRDRTAAQTLIAPGSMASFTTGAVTNGSFENDLAGWTATGNLAIKTLAPYVTTDGAKLVAFNSDQNTPNGVLTQTFATTIGQAYTFSLDIGALGYNANSQRAQISLQGATTLASELVTIQSPNGGNTRWVAKSYNFTANSATTTITISDVSTTSDSLDLVLDNVRVGAAPTRSLAITSTPVGGAAMTISPADALGAGNGTTGLIRSYANGATVTVTAPLSVGTTDFLRWQRNGVDLIGSTPAITVTMNSNVTLNAVYGSNNSPVAVADAYSTPANTPLNVPAVGVLTNDSDPDGSTLTAVRVASPTNGTLTLNPNGSFTYTPNAGYTGLDSFSYHANDGVTDSNVVTVSLTVYANASQLLTNGSFESNFTGWTNTGNMTIQSAAPYIFTNGTRLVAFNSGQNTPNGVLSQTFSTVPGSTYQLLFDMGAFAYNTAAQRLNVTVTGSSSLLNQTLSVNGLGGSGTTRWLAQSFSFVANSATTTLRFQDVSTTSNSIDLVLDNVRVTGASTARTLTVESSPINGVEVGISPADRNSASGGNTTLTRSYGEGTIVNLSAPLASGAAAFVKWQKNGSDLSTNRNINVTIDANMTLTALYGTNIAPVAVADSYGVVEGTPINTAAPGVLGNDTDADSNPLIAVLVSPPSNGTLTLNPNGGFIYIPNDGYTGTDTFTYRANDGSANSEVATVTLTVAPLASGTIANGSFEAGEAGWTMTGSRSVVDTTGAYVPTNGSKLLVFNPGQSAVGGSIAQTFATVSGQAYVLELDMGILGATTTTQRLTVNIAGSSTLINQQESITGTGLAAPRWVAKSFAFVANSATTTLTLTDTSSTGQSVDLLLDNVRLAAGSSRTLTVNSTPANGVAITVSPADISSATNGTTFFTRLYPNNTEVTLTAPASYQGGAFVKWQKNGSDYTSIFSTSVVIDGNITMTAVYAVNTAPVANADSYTVEMESSLTVPVNGVLANDTDAENQALTAKAGTGPANGTLTRNPDGSFVYTPNPGFSGSDSFTYIANDGFLDSAPATVTITVNPFAPGTLVNGSFEDGETGWTFVGNRLVADTVGPYTTTDGTKMLVLNAGNPASPGAGLSQTFATTIGKTYKVDLDMGVIGATNVQQRLRVVITGAVELVNQLETITAISTSNTTATWFPKSYTFVADSTSTTLGLVDQSTSSNNRELLVDNVRCGIRIQRALTVNSTPDTGLAITVSPNDINAAGSGVTSLSRTYDNGATVTLTAPATAGVAEFLKWTRNGVDHATTASTTVTMNADVTMVAIYGINNPPVATGETYSVNQDAVLTVPAPGVLGNDSDLDGATLTAVVDQTTTNGVLNINTDGGFTYTPNSGFSGSDSFTYRASDGVLTSNLVTVNITVEALATGAIVNGSFEQGETGWTITGNRAVIDSSNPYNATDEVKLMVLNAGQNTPNAVLTQTVATTPGQAYVLQLDMGVVGATTVTQRLGVTVNGSSQLVAQLESLAGTGLGTVNWAAKSYSFTANSASTTLILSDFSTTGNNVDLLLDNVRILSAGTRTLTVAAAAGNGLNVTVSPADRTGAANGFTRFNRYYNNNAAVTLTAPPAFGGGNFIKWQRNGSDFATTASTTVTMDADYVMSAVYSSPPQLLVNGNFEDGLNGWTPTGNLEIKSGSPYTTTDGTFILGFNTAQTTPNGLISQTFPTVVGQTYELTFDMGVLAYNTNSQRLQVTVQGATSLLNQTLTLQGISGGMRWQSHTFSFVANSNTSTLSFRDVSTTSNVIDLLVDKVKVSGFSVQRNITIASSPSTGVPVAVAPVDISSNGDGVTQFTRTYDNGASVTLTAAATAGGLPFSKWQKNGTDLSGNPITTIVVDGDHTYTAVYAPNAVPVAVADTYSATAGTPLVVPAPGVIGNDTDADADTLTASIVTNASSGNVTLSANGGFTYTPNSGFEGQDSFTYRVNDGTDDSATATVTINVATVTPGTLVNGSFESDETGWIMTGNRLVTPTGGAYTSTDGTKLMVFNGIQSTPNAVLTQSFPTTPGQTYVLEFDMGIVGAVNSQQRLQVSLNGSSSLLNQIETIVGTGVNATRWLPKSFSFVANSGSTTLTFTDVSAVTQSIDLLLDNVRIGTGTTRTLIFNSTRSTAVPVTVSPADLNTESSGSTTFTRSYNVGAVVNVSAPATQGTDNFIQWERNGSVFATTPSANFTVNGNEYITAVYSSSPPPSTSSLIVNGSFENDYTGWTPTGATRIENPGTSFTTDGVKILSFNVGGEPVGGMVSQTFPTTPGVTYQLGYDVGVLGYNTNQQRLKMELVGATPIMEQTTTVTCRADFVMVWTPQAFTFTANSSTTTVTFIDVSTTGNGLDLFLDSVRVFGPGGGSIATRTLTVNTTPNPGQAITVSPVDQASQGNGSSNFTRTYLNGTTVNMVAPHANFVKWLRNGAWYATNPSISVTMNADITMTAVYTETPVVGPFTNGSFESEFTGWTWAGSQQSVKVKDGLPATDGLNVIEFNSNSSLNDGSIRQTFTTSPGTVYTVQFDQGVLAFNTSNQVLRATVTNASNTTLVTNAYTLRGIGNGATVWATRSFTFTANSATSTLIFADNSTVGAGLDLLLDNVRVTPPGPGGTVTTRTLTVASSGASSVPVTLSPVDTTSQGNGTTQFTRTYDENAVVTLTAPTTSGGATFSKWQRNGVDVATTVSTTVTMNANYTMTAIYTTSGGGGGGVTAFTNGSFESGLASWTTAGASGTVNVRAGSPATNGTNIVEFNSANTANNGVLSQTFTTVSGTVYTVSFDQGVLSFNTNNQIIRATVTNTSGATLATNAYTLKGVSGGATNWAARSFTFTANSTTSTLTFADQSTTGAGLDLLLDNVVVSAGSGGGGGGGGGGATQTLTVNTTPSTGMAITVSPVDNASQGNGTSNFTRTYNTGTTVSLVAPFANFVKWTRNGAWYSTNPSITVTMDGSHVMTAVYTSTPVLGPFTNGSFESEFTGWTWTGSQQSVKVKDGLPATNGLNVIEFNSNSSANDGAISQTFTTTPGTSYVVSFDQGVLSFNTNNQVIQALVTSSANATLVSQNFTLRGISNGATNWATRTITFTATTASSTLTFRDQSTTGAGLDLLLDNVVVVANNVTPPPSGTNLIVNPSFELDPDFVGWTQTGNNRIERPGPIYTTTGNRILSYGVGDTAPNGEVSQTFPTVVGRTYQLDFDLGALGVVNREQRVRVRVTGGTSLVDVVTSVMGRSDFTMVWVHRTYTFTANSTSTTLTFTDASTSSSAMDMFIDTVSVVSTGTTAPAPAAALPPSEGGTSSTPEEGATAGTDTETSGSATGSTALLPGTPQIILPSANSRTRSAPAVRILYAATEAGIYNLQGSDNLSDWTDIGEPIEIEEAGTIEFQDAGQVTGRKFYRVGKTEPAPAN